MPEDYVDSDLVSLLSKLDPVVAGWGATQTFGASETVLRQAGVPLVTLEQCEQAYQGVNVEIGQSKVGCG